MDQAQGQQKGRRVTVWFLVVSLGAIILDFVLRSASIQFDAGELLKIGFQGVVAAGLSGLLGPYFMIKSRRGIVRQSGIVIWLLFVTLIQSAIYFSETLGGM